MRLVRTILSAVLVGALAFPVPALALPQSITRTVSFADANTGYIGGSAWHGGGFASVTRDGGQKWHAAEMPSDIFDVNAESASLARAVSDYSDRTWMTADTGASWSERPSAGASLGLAGIGKFADGTLVAVGTLKGSSYGDLATILTSADSGNSWTTRLAGPIQPPSADPEAPQPPTYAELTGLAVAPGSSTAWAIGKEWGDANKTLALYKQPLVYKTADAGATWTTQTALPGLLGGSGWPATCVTSPDPLTAFVGSYAPGKIAYTSNGGASWSSRSLGRALSYGGAYLDIYGIDATDANHIVAVGGTLNGPGMIWYTSGGVLSAGTFYQPNGALINWRSVDMIDDTHWVIVGEDENIARTNDGGATWSVNNGLQAPTVTVGAPTSGSVLAGSDTTVTGTANDGTGVGVTRVEVVVKRNTDNRYWNGASWQASPAWTLATTSDGWDTWSWGWHLEPYQDGTTPYSVLGRARDGAGNWSTTRTVSPVTVDNFAAMPPGGMAGTVKRSGTGAPIAGASVKVSTMATATTAGDGTYAIPGITPGAYTVHFSGAGFVAADQPVAISSGATATVNATLTALVTTGTVTGTVRDAASDTVLAGVSVQVGSMTPVTTDVNGLYTVTGVPAGGYTVGFSKTGYVTHSELVTVTAGGTASLDARIAQVVTSGTLRGTVMRKIAGTPIEGATVQLGALDTTLTGIDGTYLFTGVPAGSYDVTYSAPGFVPQKVGLVVTAGLDTQNDVFLVSAIVNSSVSGVVRRADNHAPLEGVSVAVGSQPAVTTGVNGTFTVDNVPPGTYDISYTRTGYTAALTTGVVVGSGAAITVPDTLMSPEPSVTGLVQGTVTRASDHAPIAGATVQVGSLPATTTGAMGDYSVPDVPTGTYSVTVLATGYTSRTFVNVAVVSGGITQQNAELSALVSPPPTPAAPTISRASGANRYSVAVGLAQAYKPSLTYTDVIVACGEDRAMADPLGAAGLAGAWDAPVLLTTSKRLDASTAGLISAIRNANGGRVNIHVIGGTTSVPKAVYNSLSKLKGAGSIERISGANRYVVSATMAARLPGELASHGKPAVAGVMLANVENPAAFYDALAASPLSARSHLPILGVRGASIPAEANAVLSSAAYAGKPRYAVNSAYLSGAARSAAGSAMASSGDRITAATQIAAFAHANGLAHYKTMGLANKLPDALTGGTVVGLMDGVLLYTAASPLSSATSAFASSAKATGEIQRGMVLGGPASVADATMASFSAAIGAK